MREVNSTRTPAAPKKLVPFPGSGEIRRARASRQTRFQGSDSRLRRVGDRVTYKFDSEGTGESPLR